MKEFKMALVRIIICLFFCTQSLLSFSQLTFSLDGSTTQSKFLDEWQTNKTIELLGSNSSSDSIPVHFRTRLFLNDTLLLAYNHDSLGHVFSDTLLPGSNYFHLNSLLPISTARLNDTFAVSYEKNGELMSGEFKMIVQVILADTAYDSLYINFEVEPYSAPSLEGPYDNCNLYRSNTTDVAFTWNPVNPTPPNSVVYHFKLYEYELDTTPWEQVNFIELDSNSDSDTAYFDVNPLWYDTSVPPLQDIQWLAKNSPSIYEDQVTDLTELYLPSYISELLYNQYSLGKKRYAWVVTAYDALNGEPIGSNLGSAYPFIFNITNSFADTNYVLNKNGEYCPNNGFETGNAEGWQFWKGSREKRAWGLISDKMIWKSGRVADYHDVVSYAMDPKVYDLYTTNDPSNLHSLRVGNTHNGGDAAKASHTFTVSQNTTNLKLTAAIVLEPGDHKRHVDAFYEVRVYRNGYYSFPIYKEKVIVSHLGELMPYTGPQGNFSYRQWHCNDINLADRVGQTITIEIVTSDCREGGHLAYAYIDFCAAGNVLPSFTLDSAS